MKYVYALRTVDSFLFGVPVGRNSTNNPIATKMQWNLRKILYLLPTTKTINASIYYNQQHFITIFRHVVSFCHPSSWFKK